tara:strand:+ start:247 stop:462 length:216 start_codon:yes stop_codon:yes gene_type:complete
MSAEKTIFSDPDNLPLLKTPVLKVDKIKNRVDINDLLARVREEKTRENKTNLIFVSLIASVILVVGIILSL